jgi:hypothetical protein
VAVAQFTCRVIVPDNIMVLEHKGESEQTSTFTLNLIDWPFVDEPDEASTDAVINIFGAVYCFRIHAQYRSQPT